MTQQERRGWLIVASLFTVLLLVFGSGYNTVAVFVPALLRAFPHWTRAEVALLPSVLALSAGVSVLPIGWLLDRVEARLVMIFGAVASRLGFPDREPGRFALPDDGRLSAVGCRD